MQFNNWKEVLKDYKDWLTLIDKQGQVKINNKFTLILEDNKWHIKDPDNTLLLSLTD